METIKVNQKVVGVPSDTIFDYMKYRKSVKACETDLTEFAEETKEMYANNIKAWVDKEPKLKGLTFEEVISALEETTNKLLEDLKM